ncbi:hypothetical protein [Celeribacter baekdonensis]|uniref:KAP family P-loop domain-containing protein n=1 Tax=Celeribacter baekdonensis TaxID=875171 RepID=A0A2R4M7H9_9RHOB|nr:hypothetical protein [Celeribacter baekdonensis]AVW92999.1 hypothetical protein DA792_19505 [Celeribacter baekdonensis]
MSLDAIKQEIEGFLSTDIPEVLCITGKWGVGKTHAWRTFLASSAREGGVGLEPYSYVSLFGANSIEDVKYCIFENTVENIEAKPDEASLEKLIKSSRNAKVLEKLGKFAATIFNRADIGAMLSRSAFMLVRRQIICLDDLERSGSGLTANEVMGLVSLLKEERECKVVMLLNDEQYLHKDDFELQLEKVADHRIDFELTPAEAADIALSAETASFRFLRNRVVQLKITNIRVIKKIEKLADKTIQVLSGCRDNTMDRAIATVTLAGWAVHEPKSSPSLSSLKGYSHITAAMAESSRMRQSPQLRLRDRLDGYPFYGSNPLDVQLIDAVETGIWRGEDILHAAQKFEEATEQDASSFDQVWEKFYSGPLVEDEGIFLNELLSAAKAEVNTINSEDINNTVKLLRGCGVEQGSDELIELYISKNDDQGPEFFNLSNHHFLPEDLDSGLKDALDKQFREYQKNRNPMSAVVDAAKGGTWKSEDAELFGELGLQEVMRIFECLPSGLLRPAVGVLREMGRDHPVILQVVDEALQSIANSSKLRAAQLKALGCLDAGPPTAAVGVVRND